MYYFAIYGKKRNIYIKIRKTRSELLKNANLVIKIIKTID